MLEITPKKARKKPVPNKPKVDAVIQTPIGPMGIAVREEQLISLSFLERQTAPVPFKELSPFLKKIIKQLENFFITPQSLVKLPHVMQGSAFQCHVWEALKEIPVGQTWTYGELAKMLGTAPRAIGAACRTNPLPLIIPCHRVVSTSSLGGFCGNTQGKLVAVKKWLLAHEARTC